MAPGKATGVEGEILQLLKEINETWVKGDPKRLADFFHENMVIVHPDFTTRGEGREVCVQSYLEFCNNAKVLDFKEMNHAVDRYGDTVVATYRFEITYEMNGETYDETGWDLFVLVRREGRWLVAWRTLIPFPPEEEHE